MDKERFGRFIKSKRLPAAVTVVGLVLLTSVRCAAGRHERALSV